MCSVFLHDTDYDMELVSSCVNSALITNWDFMKNKQQRYLDFLIHELEV